MSSKNPFRKLYKKLRRMTKYHDFIVRSMHNIPHEDGGIIKIKIEWGNELKKEDYKDEN